MRIKPWCYSQTDRATSTQSGLSTLQSSKYHYCSSLKCASYEGGIHHAYAITGYDKRTAKKSTKCGNEFWKHLEQLTFSNFTKESMLSSLCSSLSFSISSVTWASLGVRVSLSFFSLLPVKSRVSSVLPKKYSYH